MCKSSVSRLLGIGWLLLATALVWQCGAEDNLGQGNNTPCAAHTDCPAGFSCIIEQGICGSDPNAVPCASNADCVEGTPYVCAITDTIDGTGKCIPGGPTEDGDDPVEDGDTDESVPTTCSVDAQCGNTDYFCCLGACEEKYPLCQASRDCWAGQRCNTSTTRCEGAVPSCAAPDGDDDKPVDGDPDEIDTTEPDVPDIDDTPVDGDTTDNSNACSRRQDCPEGMVCGPGGVCVDWCTESSCPEGSNCNSNNGLCEFCDTACPANQCCNYNQDFWYCGHCCVPPCPSDQACQGGTCVPLQCPTCAPDKCCKDEETGFICVPNTHPACGGSTDGDTDAERVGSLCLPANASCIEGVDTCCSGTCLMGTCL